MPMLAGGPRMMGLAFAAGPIASLERKQRTFALGIAPAGDKQFRLAIRTQRHELSEGPEIERLIKMAKGEVDLRFIGRVQKRAASLQSTIRPLAIGCSVAHTKVTAGTLGGFVKKRRGGGIHMLSNNHVLANENAAAVGDAILQPGPLDGGKLKSKVGALSGFVALKAKSANKVDSAIAEIAKAIDTDPRRLRQIGLLRGVRGKEVDEGLRVAKVGRTTGVTRGRVTAFEVDDVVVAYTLGNVSFNDQIEIEGIGSTLFSDGGDSGSLIVDSDGFAVAQLFAGSEQGGRNGKGLTYATPIQTVLDSLRVDLLY
jgi:hypothetical protein